MTSKEIIRYLEDTKEELSQLEHQQWCDWSMDIAETEFINIKRLDRWKQLWRPYSSLPEEAKDMGR